MTEPRYCEWVVYRATLEQPEELCPNLAAPGEDYCEEHLPDPEDFDDFEPPSDDELDFWWGPEEEFEWFSGD